MDTFGRIGGKEFAVILHLTLYQAVLDLAERLRSLVATSGVPYQGEVIEFTISFGVMILDRYDEDIKTTIKRVDNALYKAKNSERKKVKSILKTQQFTY